MGNQRRRGVFSVPGSWSNIYKVKVTFACVTQKMKNSVCKSYHLYSHYATLQISTFLLYQMARAISWILIVNVASFAVRAPACDKWDIFWYFARAVRNPFLTHCTGDLSPVSDSACSFLNELFWTLPWKLPSILGVKIGKKCAFLNLLWAIVVFQKLYQSLIVRAVFISFQIWAKNVMVISTIQRHGENWIH